MFEPGDGRNELNARRHLVRRVRDFVERASSRGDLGRPEDDEPFGPGGGAAVDGADRDLGEG